MKLFDYRVFVNANPDDAFRVVSDPRSKLAWVPAIRRVELHTPPPPGPGTRYLASSGGGPLEFAFQEQITEWIENERVAYFGRSAWGEFKTLVEFRPEAAGVQLHFRMDYKCPGGWPGEAFGRVVCFFIRPPMEVRAAARLKEVIEKRLWQPISA